MNTTQLKCFTAVARNRSFSKAAAELYLAQSSVSRYVSQLEEEWGITLFIRSGRSVALTPAGEEYYRLCLRYEKDFADLRMKYRQEKEKTVLPVNYSVFPAWNIARLLHENAQLISEAHPNWKVSLKLCKADMLVKNLLSGELDLIFFMGEMLRGYEEISVSPVLELPQVIVFSDQNPLANKPGLKPEDFKDRDFLYVPDQLQTPEMVRRQIRSVEKKYGFTYRARAVSDPEELSFALESDQGVALMDVWSRYKSTAGMKGLDIDLPLTVVLAWRKDCTNPAVPQFVRETTEYFRHRGF